MSTCFVIQPFDRAKFDRRYNETFAPAIKECGLEPYRVDQDPTAEIPIQDIEAGIRNAAICLADITLDNPNVWFELGFAIASRKPVIMVCEIGRTKFPFDVQHRSIISYATESVSDFEKLKQDIVERTRAVLKKAESMQVISASNSISIEGLAQYEIAFLASMIANEAVSGHRVYADTIRRDMNSAGFTNIAFGVAVKSLNEKEFIVSESFTDYDGTTIAYVTTPVASDWVLKNQDSFAMRHPKMMTDDEIPF